MADSKSPPSRPGQPGGGAQPIAVRFSEAIEFLRRRLRIDSAQWSRMLAEEGVVSSAIADDTVRSMVESFIAAVEDVLSNGGTLESFRADYRKIVDAAGWEAAGEPSWHSRLVFRLHTGSACAAGRWEQAKRLQQANPSVALYGRLITAGDSRVRHTHREMQGIIRPIDDPYWLTHWPPNGFNCRCHVQLLTERDLRRYRFAVTPDGDARLQVPADPGWGFNPGVVGARLAQLQDTG